jgi:adenylate kinase family enzyme
MDAAGLHGLLQAARARLQAGEEVEVAECEALIRRVNGYASTATTGELRLLKAGVDDLTEAVHARMEEIDEALQRVHDGRRGVHGYAQLRSHSTAQRLRKRV